jgi:hypothetical protein
MSNLCEPLLYHAIERPCAPLNPHEPLRFTLPEVDPDRLRAELMRVVRDRNTLSASELRWEMAFPFVVERDGVHLGIAQCHVFRFKRPRTIYTELTGNHCKVGVLLACLQQRSYHANFAFARALTPDGLDDAAYSATRFNDYFPNCREFGVTRDTGRWPAGRGLIKAHYRCSWCDALQEYIYAPGHSPQ